MSKGSIFEDLYLEECECGEEVSWNWDSLEMVFFYECSCGRNHKLIPLTADSEIDDSDAESLYDDDED